jgi:MEMO1 family protein
MREAIVAGSFYDAKEDRLSEQIEGCFRSPLGPGTGTGNKGNIKGVIVPHAGYFFSGPCAAHAYQLIAGSDIRRFIILGVNHHGHETGVSGQDWSTPLGIAKCDKEAVEILSDDGIKISETPHIKEHSIEVQLPFLQHIKKDFTFAAIGIGHDADIERIAAAVSKIKKTIIIASSDFTHYGFNYGYMPFSSSVKENLERLDGTAIQSILSLDMDGFRRHVNRTGMTICGYLPILTLMACMRSKGKLLKYYTSGDVLGDFSNSVSYACIAFE